MAPNALAAVDERGGKTASRSLDLEAGGLSVSLEVDSVSLMADAQERYAPFLTRSPAAYRLGLDVVPSNALERDGWTPSVSREGRFLRCRSPLFSWRIDRASGRGRGALKPTAQALDGVLRTLFAGLSPFEDRLLLHAAAVAVRGKGYLFVGPSGAGKTTLSSYLARIPGVRVLTDELVLVGEESDRLVLFGTPFWGEFRPPQRRGWAPLAGLFFLAKSRMGTRIETLDFARAHSSLLKCLVAFHRDRGMLERSWEMVLALLRARPARRLAWRKGDPPEAVLKAVEEAAPFQSIGGGCPGLQYSGSRGAP